MGRKRRFVAREPPRQRRMFSDTGRHDRVRKARERSKSDRPSVFEAMAICLQRYINAYLDDQRLDVRHDSQRDSTGSAFSIFISEDEAKDIYGLYKKENLAEGLERYKVKRDGDKFSQPNVIKEIVSFFNEGAYERLHVEPKELRAYRDDAKKA